KEVELRLVDRHGRTVWSAPVIDDLRERTIDVSEKRAGVYLLIYRGHLGRRFMRRVVVQEPLGALRAGVHRGTGEVGLLNPEPTKALATRSR
ncbi:MAG: hypothetical protein AAGA31_19115, partial [Bacteroidota bacterium]